MTVPPDLIRLRHMHDAAKSAIEFVRDHKRVDLNTDEMLTLALVKCIEIIGEASTQISDAYKKDHPDLPWTVMKGIRNRLIHAYFDVDLDVVWDTATINLPPLIEQLKLLIDKDST